MLNGFESLGALGYWIYPLIIWTLVWKGIALWKAGRNNHLPIFIVLLIFNTAGILPIIYLLYLKYSKEDKITQIDDTKIKKKVSAQSVPSKGKKKKK